ncbi:hypothetical protein FNF29_02000 [Cafeteria roenbergensis]|uniref:Bile salt export pump n=1 Tax=Cafeteria roenbergensis TaxID=33653 RepID=A0A5A8CRA8_CAFRO|nr:hypothetical protein FNF29_02000 [Cafeteria roenbergensis]|eukprot:KAA0155249.1 hypothetical protein FNF29_02000 [Cafeteria roenbergensis]
MLAFPPRSVASQSYMVDSTPDPALSSASGTPVPAARKTLGTSAGKAGSIEDAREEADVQGKLAREREELLADTTFCSLICPVDRTAERAAKAAKQVDDMKAKGKAVGSDGTTKSELARVPLFGSKGLFRYADCTDITLYVFGMIGALGAGSALPFFSVIFGQLLDALNNPDPVAITREMDQVALNFLYVAIAVGFCMFLQTSLPIIASERQIARIRSDYARAMTRQEVGYFETEQDPAEVASILVDTTVQIVDGLGSNITSGVQMLATSVVGLVIGFVASWDLALVILAVMPAFIVPVLVLKNSKAVSERVNGDAYARAQSVASEALTNVRTVHAFGGQRAESRRYASHLDLAEEIGMRTGAALGFGIGLLFLVMFSAYAAGMLYGAHRIRLSREENPLCVFAVVAEGATANCYTAGTLMEAFFAVLIGGSTLGQVAPPVSAVSTAMAAAGRIFAAIDRKSAIDPSGKPNAGSKPSLGASGSATAAPSAAAAAGSSAGPKARGHIEFRDVSFAFPSDPDRKVLNNFSVTVRPGETLALVGESGSGKSTIVQLLMRFYDPQSGVVLLDGKDIKEYDVAWLRSQMGLVSQEPSLFSTSIEENIALGLPGYRSNFGEISTDVVSAEDLAASDAASRAAIESGTGVIWGGVEISGHRTTDDLAALPPTVRTQVEAAAKAASAHDFVSDLPRSYRTRVGDRGGQLSGGQKQRVAIARALIRKPAIFIGDEATSALDSESEKQVSAAIDKLLSGPSGSELTSVLIAHRLSTITKATTIVVMDRGTLVEQGTHAELLARKGVYHALAAGQGLAGGDPAQSAEAAAIAEAVEAELAAASAAAAAAKSGDGSSIVGSPRMRPTRSHSVGSDGGATGGDATPAPVGAAEVDIIRSRVEAFLAREGRAPVDRLFFALLDGATGPAQSAADAEAAMLAADNGLTGSTEKLSRSEPRIVLLQSAFLEMALSEKRWFMAWWLQTTEEEVRKAEAMIGGGGSSSVGSGDSSAGAAPVGLKAALASITSKLAKGASPQVLPETEKMVKDGRDSKTVIWDLAPTAAKGGVLHLPPARSRNGLLDSLLTASRPVVSMGRILSYQRPEMCLLVVALVAGAFGGAMMPVFALALSDMMTVFYKVGDEFEDGILLYTCLFFGVGVVGFIANWVQNYAFVTLGARLTTRLRKMTFAALLRQEVAFFDYPSNSAGQLSGRLAGDAALVRAATGEKLGVSMAATVSLLAGFIIALVASWQLTLVVLAVAPFMAFGAVMEGQVFEGFGGPNKAALETSARIIDEATRGNRTVAGLGMQEHVSRSFDRSLEGPRREAVSQGLSRGAAVGLGQFINYAVFALVFWTGSRFVADGIITVNDVFRAFFGLSFGISGSSSLGSAGADIGKSTLAASSIFALVDRTPKMDSMGADDGAAAVAVGPAATGQASPMTAVKPAADPMVATPGSASGPGATGPTGSAGRVEFKNVTFSYPARPEAVALRDFSAAFEADSTVGLVGPSGSGKSTIVQLLMRFYDPDSGTILLDGKDLKEYNIAELRDKMSLVGQEPSLFSDTVHYNIAYGRGGGVANKPEPDLGLSTEDNPTVKAARPQVVEAATSAFAHDFISHRLPLGYSTFVGNQGSSRLSGGQKQRVAIARALIRKPAFLIGDEVTSALDTKSEQEVQRALDALVEEAKSKKLRRTSVFVAHRLSTLRDATNIMVLENGRLVEQGAHDALMARPGGLYARLAKAQQIAAKRHGATSPPEEASAAEGAAAAAAAPDAKDAVSA